MPVLAITVIRAGTQESEALPMRSKPFAPSREDAVNFPLLTPDLDIHQIGHPTSHVSLLGVLFLLPVR
jgi:hypothetical protein